MRNFNDYFIAIVIPLAIVILGACQSVAPPLEAGEMELSVAEEVSPPVAPAKHALAAVNDISIYYEVQGAGEPLLLLHGGTGCADVWTWGNQLQVLGEHYMVIAPDSRAQGRSTDSDQPLSYQLMADDMVRLLDHLGIESAYVVGWSDGGNIGLEMAIRYPERVRGLVATGAQFRADGMIPEEIEWTETLSVDSFPEDWLDMCYRSIAPNPAHLPQMLEKIRAMWLTEEYVSFEGLGTITAPVLLLEGTVPDFVQTEHTEALAAAIPEATLQWIKETGHLAPIEKSDEWNEAVLDFLNEADTKE